MEIIDPDKLRPFLELIDSYNQSFYDRSIESFRSLHVDDDDFVFFDNHAGCDSGSYKEHEVKVKKFLQTGNIVNLRKENVRVFRLGKMACITLILRYSSAPSPGVRCTYIVECPSGEWKLRHMHHSFDPNERYSS